MTKEELQDRVGWEIFRVVFRAKPNMEATTYFRKKVAPLAINMVLDFLSSQGDDFEDIAELKAYFKEQLDEKASPI